MEYYLAIDIGASSGRHILGCINDGKLNLEEIYRFDNGLEKQDGNLVWNVEKIAENVINGIAECKKIGKIPKTVAIDTWGVDYVLLDKDKNLIPPVFSYRDPRTENIIEETEKYVSYEELYSRTGMHKQAFNTVYQLYCDKMSGKLDKAEYFMMIPDYLSYVLTGKIANEYTNATTGALVNAQTHSFDLEIIKKLGFPEKLFKTLCLPATGLGGFSQEIKERVGFDATVVHTASHDTASAVAACPIDGKSVYISSGTWSLIGTENKEPQLSSRARMSGFSNEGGVEYRFRFLENIMGMWLFQSIRKSVDKKYTYDEMMEMAMASSYKKKLNPNDSRLVAPDDMLTAVREVLGEKDLPLADALKSIYISLADAYDGAIKEIESISNKKIDNIIIVGGGSKDKYLDALTARVTGKKVFTGLDEATATGNIIAQIMYDKKIGLDNARTIIKNSFAIREEKL